MREKAIQGRIAQQQKNKEVKPAMKMLNKTNQYLENEFKQII